MVPINIEYVSEDDVLADIAIKSAASASLRTTNAILLAVLLMASYTLNIILITTVYTSKKLRAALIYVIFAHISLVNLLELSLSVLLSLMYVANGAWVFGNSWCRINAMVQEFCQLYTLLLLMLAAVERAVGLSFDSQVLPNQRPSDQSSLFTTNRVLVFALLLAVASLAVSIPSGAGILPVRPFRNRYVCAVGSGAPIGYSLSRVVLYIGCLCVLLVCVAAIFKKREGNSLPPQSHDYSDFIRKNRAKKEHLSRAKLVVLLVSIFILVSGPYVTLSLTYEICNSSEFLAGKEPLLDIPQDADTLITWLMFLFPLLCPISIFCWCTDVWGYAKELFCCQSDSPPSVGYFANGYNKCANGMPGVMTLVVTPEGLQLKLPSSGLSDTARYSQSLALPQPYEPVEDTYPQEGREDRVVRDVQKLETHSPIRKPEKQNAPAHRKNELNKAKPPARGKAVSSKARGVRGRGENGKRGVANARRPV